MGDEVRCRVRFGDATSEGKALLETDELRFRGDFRLTVGLREIESVEAAKGELAVRFDGGEAVFELGPKAARWADRIRNPRTRLDKLGVKPDSVVSVIGLEDADFRAELEARIARYATDPAPESDLVLLGAESVADLERIAGLVPFLKPNGHIWVVAPKGRRDIREIDVIEAGRGAGLEDTKVARFSETHTAHRFTIPLESR